MPMRSSFDPCDVPTILSTFELHEFRDPNNIIVRLSGAELADRYGFDITGKNYLYVVQSDRRDKVRRALSIIVEHTCGNASRYRGHAGIRLGPDERVRRVSILRQ